MSIVFENNGVIDLRGIRTFGVSAKQTSNPIGFFGTGLKYAIAICLREGLEIKMYRDGEEFVFGKKHVDMRGKTFDAVTMNGEELPFTTELGKNWQVWQVFRELHCNAIDEGGGSRRSGLLGLKSKPNSTGKTVFVVDGEAMKDVWLRRDEIILPDPFPYECVFDENIKIYRRGSKSVFFKGVRVLDFLGTSVFTYDIQQGARLTEDRTLQSPSIFANDLARIVATKMTDRSVIRQILTAPRACFESDLSFYLIPSEEGSTDFVEAISEEFGRNNENLNNSAREWLMRKKNKRAARSYDPVQLNEVQEAQLHRAREVCRRVWPDFDDYPIMVVKHLGQTTMALADRHDNTIVISLRCFTSGTKYLVSTLIEEYLHLKTGYDDMTRDLQTHLFDTVTTMIETHVLREPI